MLGWFVREEFLHFILEGEYDFSNAYWVKEAFEIALKNPHSILLLHTEPVKIGNGYFQICSSGCSFMDVSTLRVLVSNFIKDKQKGREVWVILTPHLKKFFDIVNFTKWCDKVELRNGVTK